MHTCLVRQQEEGTSIRDESVIIIAWSAAVSWLHRPLHSYSVMRSSVATSHLVHPLLHMGSSVPSRARHQRGGASRTHSWGNRTSRSESSSRSTSKRSFGTSTVFSDRAEFKKKGEFRGRISTHITRQTPCSNCGLEKNFCVGQRINGSCNWKIVGTGGGAASSTLGYCLPRLRSRRFRSSRAGPWTWSSLRRKMQLVNCTRKATSDRWQACVLPPPRGHSAGLCVS